MVVGRKLAQALAVAAATSLADRADQAVNRVAPSSPMAPFSAMPIRTHES